MKWMFFVLCWVWRRVMISCGVKYRNLRFCQCWRYHVKCTKFLHLVVWDVLVIISVMCPLEYDINVTHGDPVGPGDHFNGHNLRLLYLNIGRLLLHPELSAGPSSSPQYTDYTPDECTQQENEMEGGSLSCLSCSHSGVSSTCIRHMLSAGCDYFIIITTCWWPRGN